MMPGLNRLASQLYDQNTFDKQFLQDIQRARISVIIESPFIRLNRIEKLLPTISKLRRQGIKIIINTRNPVEHSQSYRLQAEQSIEILHSLGVLILFTDKHHRKLAVIDQKIFYEGSLNILSYYRSCEIMRRTVSNDEASVLLRFIGLEKYLMKGI